MGSLRAVPSQVQQKMSYFSAEGASQLLTFLSTFSFLLWVAYWNILWASDFTGYLDQYMISRKNLLHIVDMLKCNALTKSLLI